MPMAAHIWWSCGQIDMPGAHTTFSTVSSGEWCKVVSSARVAGNAASHSDVSLMVRSNRSEMAKRGSDSFRPARHSATNPSTSSIGLLSPSQAPAWRQRSAMPPSPPPRVGGIRAARGPGDVVAQQVLHHLPGRVARQLVDEGDLPRALVVREVLGAERLELVALDVGVGLAHDEGGDVLTEHVVRYGDDRGLTHRRVFEDHALDVGRVHVVPAADDEVLLASDEVEEPVVVEVAEVAAAQPAVTRPGARGGVGVLVVLALTTGQARQELAHLVGCALVVVVVDDLDLHRRHRLAHGPDALRHLFLGHHDERGA